MKKMGFYRLSVDDNIIFLWDITRNKDKYNSIFDNPYLAIYKRAHELYGAKVHLNIYYEMPAISQGFSEERECFNLSEMTDKFKTEWAANSDWLKLNFHAKTDQPAYPYKDVGYRTIYEDCKMVQREIIRFAGETSLSEETTIHCFLVSDEGIKAIRDLDIKYLVTLPDIAKRNPPVVCCNNDIILNKYKIDEILSSLDALYIQKSGSGFLELMIHEQYYYKDYTGYIPEYKERIFEACRWAVDKGYTGSFIGDAICSD